MHFKTSSAVALAALLTQVASHGIVTSIQGANGVTMPGLGVIDGTPRDCSTKGCGAENDTPVFKDGNGVLGATKGGGAITAEQDVAAFMGAAGANNTAAGAAGAEQTNKRRHARSLGERGLLADLLAAKKAKKNGGAAQNAAANGDADDADATLATGSPTASGTTEQGQAAAAGKGAQSGLPTVGQDGVITMNFHQVNADGAGPYTAAVDPTSGGTSEAAFQPAQMKTQIPGKRGRDGQNKASDFQVQVQMPQGMKCQGTVAGQQNVCVVRIKNPAQAGPFGGSAVFTQDNGNNGTANGNSTSTNNNAGNSTNNNNGGSNANNNNGSSNANNNGGSNANNNGGSNANNNGGSNANNNGGNDTNNNGSSQNNNQAGSANNGGSNTNNNGGSASNSASADNAGETNDNNNGGSNANGGSSKNGAATNNNNRRHQRRLYRRVAHIRH